MMSCAELILAAPWLIPIEPLGVVLEDHAIVVENGRIADVLPRALAQQNHPQCPIEDLEGQVLLPGLVNTHCHAAMSLMRGIADDLPLMDWLTQHIWPLEQRWVGDSFVRDGTQLAIAEMIRGGITTFNDMYFFPEVTAREVTRAGMRATLGLIAIDFPTAWAKDPDEYLQKGLALRDEYLNDSLVSFALAPHAPYTVSDPLFLRIGTLASELDLPIHTHLHETADEIAQGLKHFGVRPLKRLQNLNLLGPGFMAVHMTQLIESEMELLAETGAHVIHCPESNLKLASGFCPVSELIGRGVNVGLGTDGAASNNDLNLMGEMRTAALIAKAVSGNAAALPAPEALAMATLGGARALGLDHRIGSLVPGKAADFISVDLRSIETAPGFNPISDLVYAADRHLVSNVWIEGKRLLKNRQLLTLDLDEVRQRCAYWHQRLSTH